MVYPFFVNAALAEFEANRIAERIVEPDRTFTFKVVWVDDKGDVQVNMVFKLSRFGRNAADVLNSLQLMQDFGVNLIRASIVRLPLL